MSEASGVKRAGQCKRMNDVSKQANGQVGGPVLTSRFSAVYHGAAVAVAKKKKEKEMIRKKEREEEEEEEEEEDEEEEEEEHRQSSNPVSIRGHLSIQMIATRAKGTGT